MAYLNIPNLAGTLYVDGHERVYHGKKTKLPKRYFARERLCLRGVTDYRVNDALGQPFFVVSKTVNPGMLKVLRTEIVPRLMKDVPNQPDKSELEADRYLFRFGIVFDREGYGPGFFKAMWKERIVCYTYRKYARKDWPKSEFMEMSPFFFKKSQFFSEISLNLRKFSNFVKASTLTFKDSAE